MMVKKLLLNIEYAYAGNAQRENDGTETYDDDLKVTTSNYRIRLCW